MGGFCRTQGYELLGLFVLEDLVLVFAEFIQQQAVGRVLGVLGGGIVAILATSAL
jgi:hypothetical protein